MSAHIFTPIENLTRVGKVTAKRLSKLGIVFVKDLLEHYPSRHEDYSHILSLKNLREGILGSIIGAITSLKTSKTPLKKMNLAEAYLSDGAGLIKIIWFNQVFLGSILKEGDKIIVAGKIERDYSGWVIKNPQYEKWSEDSETIHTGRIVPIYPTTGNITQKQIRFLLKQALPAVGEFGDLVPPAVRRSAGLLGKREAIKFIHFPADLSQHQAAARSLKFEELFLIQLLTQKARFSLGKLHSPAIPFNEAKTRQLVKSLPFELTLDQRRVTWQILLDLQKPQPMNRLLQGEVGSGKTVVAAIAALNAAEAGWQTAIMAPTEILAFQHFKTIGEIFPDKPIALLTGKYNEINPSVGTRHGAFLRNRGDIKEMVASGEIDIIIGTHAILQNDVEFKKLGLVVIDEQHRFGVQQRQSLRVKSPAPALRASTGRQESREGEVVPHFLSMTATPIPRSLALTLYGDLDISTIRTMPERRKPILTKIIKNTARGQAYQFIRQRVKLGEQAFVICPLVEESDALGVKAATAEFEKLNKEIFPDLKIGLLHGRLKTKAKEEVMAAFKNKEIDILVATAVVEVGVDVPGATMMLIEGADRFGLAQLHQFRGRIGRNDKQSYCFLFTESASMPTLQRLQSFVRAKDGFEIAELDLDWRGPGEIYGTSQSGYLDNLKIAKLTDMELIAETKKYALEILEEGPNLNNHPELQRELASQQQFWHFE